MGYSEYSYRDERNFVLKYINNTSGLWIPSIVDSDGNVGYSTSLAFDALGKPSISYFDWSNRDLKFATVEP